MSSGFRSIYCVPVTSAGPGHLAYSSKHTTDLVSLPRSHHTCSSISSGHHCLILWFSLVSVPFLHSADVYQVSACARLDSGYWGYCEQDKVPAGEDLTLKVGVEDQTDDKQDHFRGCRCNEEDKAGWLRLQVEAVSLLGDEVVQWLKAPSLEPDWQALSPSSSLTSYVPQFLYLSNGDNNSA